MTIDQVIALAASTGACMAAIATFLTVLQISKQRKASYRPELALSRTIIEGVVDEAAASHLPSLWTAQLQDNMSTKDHSAGKRCAIPLANIGLGAAKGVKVSWNFPIEELVEQLNKRAQRTLTPAYFTFDKNIFSVKSEKLGNWTSMWINQRSEKIDYVVPIAIQREAFMLTLPHAYIGGISALLALSFDDKDNEFPDIPSLRVEFEYLDVADENHQSTFKIQFHLIMMGNNGRLIHAYLEPFKRD
jgi:hypothetical protein